MEIYFKQNDKYILNRMIHTDPGEIYLVIILCYTGKLNHSRFGISMGTLFVDKVNVWI